MDVYGRKINNILLVALFFVMCVACREKVPPHEKEANRVVWQVANELVEERQLTIGAFGSSMMDKVEEVSFWFHSQERHDREQARELYITIVNKFLDSINGDEKLRPYLAEVPFPPERLDIKLSYDNEKGNPLPEDKVAFVTQAGGKIHYSARTQDGGFIELGVPEGYLEALKENR